MRRGMRALLLLLVLGLASAAKMPSCEEDTVASCLGDDADMSPEGIDKCLRALPARSTSCEEYLKIVKECSEDLDSGPCSRARDDGEEMLCLIVRTKPDELSAACQAALPKKEEVKRDAFASLDPLDVERLLGLINASVATARRSSTCKSPRRARRAAPYPNAPHVLPALCFSW
jgi:hypothetical protein